MRTRLPIYFWRSLWQVILVVLSAQMAPASTSGISVATVFLGKQPDNMDAYFDSLAFSPDMHHFAYVAAGTDGMQVGVDNKVGKKYSHIIKGYPIFSPVKNRVGYIADKDHKYFVVIDDKEYPDYDGACCLGFSPNGEYTAFIAQSEGKQFVVLNGHRLKPYDMIDRVTGVQFSPDSQSAAYVVKNKQGQSVQLIINGKESPPFDTIKEISFSLDSKKIACIATQDKVFYVLNDNVKEGPYDSAEGLTWSPDSTHLAYIAIKDGRFWVIDNNQRISAGEYAPRNFFYKEGGFATLAPQTTPPVFSPDSSLMAFTQIEGDKFRNITGKNIGPLFDKVSRVFFSPDSKHYAYIGISQTPVGVKMRIMRDGVSESVYDLIDQPEFSPDSQKLAYRVMDKGKWFIVSEGSSQKSYDSVGFPVFSPDSRVLAYQAIEKDKALMVVNGKEESYEVDNPRSAPNILTKPCFSPDSRYLAYLVRIKSLQCVLVINGVIVQTLDAGFSQTIEMPLVFNSNNNACFIAAFFKNERFEAFQINITFDQQKQN